MSKQKTIVIISLSILLIVVYFIAFRGKRYAPGIIVKTVPQQLPLAQPRTWRKGRYRINALAEFNLTARVLSTERYYIDRGADIAPVDFALGWGIMSDQSVLDSMTITQSNRWYHWHSYNLMISPGEVAAFSSNMHIIPANDWTDTLVRRVGKGDIIELRGYLVEITADDGFVWRSSLSREDTGDGACELFWVEEINIKRS
jgi:hypothetical protein